MCVLPQHCLVCCAPCLSAFTQFINEVRNRSGARVHFNDEENDSGDRILQVRMKSIWLVDPLLAGAAGVRSRHRLCLHCCKAAARQAPLEFHPRAVLVPASVACALHRPLLIRCPSERLSPLLHLHCVWPLCVEQHSLRPPPCYTQLGVSPSRCWASAHDICCLRACVPVAAA